MADMPISGDANSETLQRSVSEWQQRLLQLDRRNNLLYFRETRTTVGITAPGADELERLLQGRRSGLKFPYAESTKRRRNLWIQPEEPANPDEPPPPRVSPGDIHVDADALDLQRRLGALQRRDKEWEDEQGLNVLFLAVGFLDWIDDDAETARSPILLLACDLDRASPRDAYFLKREDDDVVVNATLRYVLGERGVELPDLGEDETLGGYLSQLNTLIARKKPGWSVSSEISLGIFQFSKMAMWEDLERIRTAGVSHSLIRTLAGESGAESQPSASDASPLDRDDASLAGGGMDDLLQLRRQFTVRPADFSQLRAIERARGGQHLVIHGPPGTGKSQTIANLIATLLADGKRILFVSEKTAALDVVKRRLEEASLGTFCLDLHSERGKKNSVYAQLEESLAIPRVDPRSFPHWVELERQREQLNAVVRALHRPLTNLELTPYEVHGAYARVQDAPVARYEFDSVEDLTPVDLAKIREAALRVAARPREFGLHYTSHWRSLTLRDTVASLTELITGDMDAVLQATGEATETFIQVARTAGTAAPDSAESLDQLDEILLLLGSPPEVPILDMWLDSDVLDSVARVATAGQSLESERVQLEEKRALHWQGVPRARVLSDDVESLTVTPGEQAALSRIVGSDWQRWIVGIERQPVAAARLLDSAVSDVERAAIELRGVLGLPEDSGLLVREAQGLSDLATSIAEVGRIPEAWVRGDLQHLSAQYAAALNSQMELRSAEALLHEFCDASAAELDDETLLPRFRSQYGSFFSRLTGNYRRDRNYIREHLRSARKPTVEEMIDILVLVRAVRRARDEWLTHADGLRSSLGHLFEDEATDLDRIQKRVATVQRLTERWRGLARTIREAWADQETCSEVALQARVLADGFGQIREPMAEDDELFDIDDSRTLSDVAEDISVLRAAVERIHDAVRSNSGDLVVAPEDLSTLRGWITELIKLERVETQVQELEPELHRFLGEWFSARSTDWPSVRKAIAWTTSLLEAVDGKTTNGFIERVSGRDIEAATGARTQLARSRSVLSERLSSLDGRFDVRRTAWASWDTAPLAALESWASILRDDAWRAASWVEYSSAVGTLQSLLGAQIVDAVRDATDTADQLPPAIERLLFQSWIDHAHSAEPALKDFSTTDFERIREDFRDLDARFIEHARARVREKCLERYPDAFQTRVNAGEIGTLRTEITKSRRKMPVRRLLRRIPGLLTSLKPCFMMSPLAVSQFLPATEIASDASLFDVVIFDEASQVFPEDAIPAIARADQLVVVGDTKQLPPTSFFRRTEDSSDDDYDEEAEAAAPNQLRDQESILHAMVGLVGQGVAESHLTVHYRSRHESLIRFSNHHFYEDRLLVFPSPELRGRGRGIVDRYVSDAVFDSGATNTNPKEAQAVVEEVITLARAHGRNESIGVVAMSRAQAELIRQGVEQRVLAEPDVAEVLQDAGTEPFFVKNLENVQGDERDHMLMSIGYGPVAGSSAVPNRFGPLTNPGGQRRLNVAVTRARESLTVFRSMQPGDIRSETDGGRILRRFLEYARAPETALAAELESATGVAESPFEESVGRALTELGYRIDYQIGVSGYRIDLGVISDESNEYLMGIECDGATYHSSPAARDRDWLRQSILEGLGWNIHRIWSTSWVRNRADEIARLQEAIRLAEVNARNPEPVASATADDPVETEEKPHYPESIAPLPPVAEDPGELLRSLFETYEVTDLSGRRVGPELVHETPEVLGDLARRVVETESPVHLDVVVDRLRDRYGYKQAGRQIRDRVLDAVFALARSREVAWETQAQVQRRAVPERIFLVNKSHSTVPRSPTDGASVRVIARISDTEIEAGIASVLKTIVGDTEEGLVKNVALAFGFKRTGPDIRSAISEAVARLLERGDLKRVGELIELAD